MKMLRLLCSGVVLALLLFLPLHAMAAVNSPKSLAGGTTTFPTAEEDRAYTVQLLVRIVDPLFSALSENQLHAKMPVRGWEKSNPDRVAIGRLEGFARSLSGIAPWLALGPDETQEGVLRARFIELCRRSLVNVTDPNAADFGTLYSKTPQNLVEAAFISEALLRAPKQLWEPLSAEEKERVLSALKASRQIRPPENNWVLFASIVEAAIWEFSGECDLPRLESGVKKVDQWYLGDGTYGDGPQFHWDYYNSYVIQPMLLDVLRVCAKKENALGALIPKMLERARTYAAVQEMMISPEAAFPVIGRSSVYRCGAFKHLSYMAFLGELPPQIKPGATRAALTAVIRRMMEAPGTFDDQGWLQPGVVGHQASLRDGYISTGSLYLCTMGFFHLGQSANSPFWQAPATPWSQQLIWSGVELPNSRLKPQPQKH